MKLCSLLISKTELYNVLCPIFYTHTYIYERFIYFQDRSVNFAAAKYVDGSWEYRNPPQTHECRIGNDAAQFPEEEYINGIFVAV